MANDGDLDIIDEYIKNTFHPDLGDQLRIALNLYDTFALEDPDLDFIDILMQDQVVDRETIRSQFLSMIHEKQNEIFRAHSIDIQDDVDIYTKNELLSALDVVQNLADYQDILPVLESDLTPEDIVSTIGSLYCELSHETILESLKSVSPILIKSMAKFFHDKETIAPLMNDIIPVMKNLIEASDDFYDYTQHKETIGRKLIQANTLFNKTIKEYMVIIGKLNLGKSIVNIAQDIYSILLLTEEGFKNPLTTYREHSRLFFDDLTLTQRVDIELTKQMQQFEAFRTHKRMVEKQTPGSVTDRFQDKNAGIET